jgi:hypothetical protein
MLTPVAGAERLRWSNVSTVTRFARVGRGTADSRACDVSCAGCAAGCLSPEAARRQARVADDGLVTRDPRAR